jgi:predicted nucleic acid-binding protein
MRKIKLYLDTSVLSHMFAEDVPEKTEQTKLFWRELSGGKFEVFVSAITLDEIEQCAEPKCSKMIGKLKEIAYTIQPRTKEVIELANAYIKNGVLTSKSQDDCMHIASAVIANCDIIVSWNFKHLVNYKTIGGVKVVNSMNYYKAIEIMSPNMIIEEETWTAKK